MDLSNTVLVTHRGCLDGSTSALIFMAAGGKRENIYFTNPGHHESDSLVWDLVESWPGDILVADASISLGLAKKLDKQKAPIRIIDHHKSAIPLNKFSWCEIDVENTRSGAMMFYDHLIFRDNTESPPSLLRYHSLVSAADDIDRWIWKNKNSEAVAGLHGALGQDMFIDRFLEDSTVFPTAKEEYLLDVMKKKRDEFVERKLAATFVVGKTVQGHKISIGYVEAGAYQSELGNAICKDRELNCDVAMIISATSVSFRASKDCPVDLSKVAKINGGGGHLRASGAGLNGILGQPFVDIVLDHVDWE